jgi:CheY-like chemotaxis protein
MSKRILVVEDQADNRQIIRDMRGDVGAWKGLVAVSGRELIIAARLAPSSPRR